VLSFLGTVPIYVVLVNVVNLQGRLYSVAHLLTQKIFMLIALIINIILSCLYDTTNMWNQKIITSSLYTWWKFIFVQPKLLLYIHFPESISPFTILLLHIALKIIINLLLQQLCSRLQQYLLLIMNVSFTFAEHHRSYQDKSYTCCRFDLHNYLAEKVYTNYNIFLHRQFQLITILCSCAWPS